MGIEPHKKGERQRHQHFQERVPEAKGRPPGLEPIAHAGRLSLTGVTCGFRNSQLGCLHAAAFAGTLNKAASRRARFSRGTASKRPPTARETRPDSSLTTRTTASVSSLR